MSDVFGHSGTFRTFSWPERPFPPIDCRYTYRYLNGASRIPNPQIESLQLTVLRAGPGSKDPANSSMYAYRNGTLPETIMEVETVCLFIEEFSLPSGSMFHFHVCWMEGTTA